jgi:Family of unknown function (DUF6375)
MIGRFKNAGDAKQVEEVIQKIAAQVDVDADSNLIQFGGETSRFTSKMLDLMVSLNVTSVGPSELEQFRYDISRKRTGSEILLTTDEVDVSAFIKLFIDFGAKVEVFSAHHHPGSGHGRGE